MAAKQEQVKTPTTNLATLDYLAARIGRPTPWVYSRLEETNSQPSLVLDGLAYFDAGLEEMLRDISDRKAEEIRRVKREAVAMGE